MRKKSLRYFAAAMFSVVFMSMPCAHVSAEGVPASPDIGPPIQKETVTLWEAYDAFDQSTWLWKDSGQRVSDMQAYCDILLDSMGVPYDVTVEVYDGDKAPEPFRNYMAYCDNSLKRIYLNSKYSTSTPQVVFDVAHESRHIWQFYCKDNPGNEYERSIAAAMDVYVFPETAGMGAYEEQLAEQDANTYAREALHSYSYVMNMKYGACGGNIGTAIWSKDGITEEQ